MAFNLDALLLAVHLLAAAAWLGAGWYDKLMVAPIRGKGTAGYAMLERYVARGGGGLWFGPASMLTVLSGGLLYWRLGIDWGTLSGGMLTAGAALGIAALGLGIAVHAPMEGRLKRAVQDGRQDEAMALLDRLDHHTGLSGYLVTAAFLLMSLRHVVV